MALTLHGVLRSTSTSPGFLLHEALVSASLARLRGVGMLQEGSYEAPANTLAGHGDCYREMKGILLALAATCERIRVFHEEVPGGIRSRWWFTAGFMGIVSLICVGGIIRARSYQDLGVSAIAVFLCLAPILWSLIGAGIAEQKLRVLAERIKRQ